MAGFLTSRRICGVNTFCDHISDYIYVHLMREFTLDETLFAKAAFEKLLPQADRHVKHYHADNGCFADNGFLDAINRKNQKISFCGVGAYHQNEIIENINKLLTVGSRALLLHVMCHWPQMIDSMFWPLAIKAIAEKHNILKPGSSGDTSEFKIFNVSVKSILMKSFHTFFCLVCVLDSQSQAGVGPDPPKWKP